MHWQYCQSLFLHSRPSTFLPKYHLGIGSLLVANVLEFITFFVLRYAFKRENRMKERNRVASLREAGVGIDNADATTAFHDMTDKENPNFVYVL